jgi:hypothetical protein
MDDTLVTTSTIVAGLLLALAMWLVFSTLRARFDGRRQAAYEQLSQAAVTAQEQVATQLKELSDAVGELNGRLAEVERLLRDVG